MLKNILIGCAQTSIFMPEGIARFAKDKSAALRSFLIPILLYPFSYAAFHIMNDVKALTALPVHFLIVAAGLALFYGVVFSMARIMGRAEKFWHFVTAGNYFGLVSFVLLLPVWISAFVYQSKTGMLEQFWIFYFFVMMAYKAFIAMHTLNLSWMMGGFIATIALFFADMQYRVIMDILQIAGIVPK